MKATSIRRLLVGSMLGAAGSFSVSCAALAQYLSYGRAPMAPATAEPTPALPLGAPPPKPTAQRWLVTRDRDQVFRVVSVEARH
jgi:hypothetical protein